MRISLARCALGAVACAALFAASAAAQPDRDPAAAVERLAAAAETSLREGELQAADSQYRSVLQAGWMLIGSLRVDEHRLADARDAFSRASTSAVAAKAAFVSLALVHLQMGEAARASTILTRVAAASPRDAQTRRLLAQALMAAGQPEQAVQELEEAHGHAADDPELTFALASGYLRLKKADEAARLFAAVAKARPLAETYVLIGRTYRDAGQYDRARLALETALKMNPRVRRAHYYLGTLAVMEEGVVRLDAAIAEFQRELTLAPTDPAANLRLGMALVEARRETAALPALELAARAASAPAEAFYYLGRCQLALDRAADAVESLRRALEAATGSTAVDRARQRSIHYLLGSAFQKLGDPDKAATHFAEAERFAAERAATEREELSRYLADSGDPAATSGAMPLLDQSPLAALNSKERVDLERRTRMVLARTYLNLGVMQAQKQRFARAAGFFEDAVAADPAFPQARYSLGVAYFNAQQYEKAAAALQPVVSDGSADADVRRMLALAYLNTEAYDKAAALLSDDPQRASDVSLQYAYGLALVRGGRVKDAEAVFSRLLADHGDTPELMVLVGQAHAQQGDYDAAIESLRKALQLKPQVGDANATLGFIYFKQGRLEEAEGALRAELAAHADNIRAQHTLGAVLDLEGRPDEALRFLRAVLGARPGFVDARYLVGKILLARGAAAEALEHLEAAARLAPDEANVHYQLGQAYQKLGRSDEAQKEFDTFRELKEKRRGSKP